MPVEYARKTFDLGSIDVRAERSKYPYEELEVGEGFLYRGKSSSISSRTSQASKKSDKVFVNRQTVNPADGESAPGAGDGASEENPFTWVIRVK